MGEWEKERQAYLDRGDGQGDEFSFVHVTFIMGAILTALYRESKDIMFSLNTFRYEEIYGAESNG